MNSIRVNGSPVVPVVGGGYVSKGNPLPVSVIGGGVELPTESNGVLSCNLNSVSSGVRVVTKEEAATLGVQNATFISGAEYNESWNSATPGWMSLFTAMNNKVKLLGVASEANQIFAFQKPNEFTLYFPCNVMIDLIGLQNGTFNGSATEGFCSVVNSSSVGILLMYWVYN